MWNIEHKFKVKIGGNYYINTSKLIAAGNESPFTIKRREEDGSSWQSILTCVAPTAPKLRRSAMHTL